MGGYHSTNISITDFLVTFWASPTIDKETFSGWNIKSAISRILSRERVPLFLMRSSMVVNSFFSINSSPR